MLANSLVLVDSHEYHCVCRLMHPERTIEITEIVLIDFVSERNSESVNVSTSKIEEKLFGCICVLCCYLLFSFAISSKFCHMNGWLLSATNLAHSFIPMHQENLG